MRKTEKLAHTKGYQESNKQKSSWFSAIFHALINKILNVIFYKIFFLIIIICWYKHECGYELGDRVMKIQSIIGLLHKVVNSNFQLSNYTHKLKLASNTHMNEHVINT